MTDASRPRRAVRPFVPGLTLVVATCLLASCSTVETLDREASASRTYSQSPSPRSEPRAREGLPTAPANHDAALLADQIALASQTLRDPDAAAEEVRRAGELQQLAVRRLAIAPARFRREVMGRLGPLTALVTRRAVRASEALHGLAEPQQEWPRWRIVAPPPAKELLGHYRKAQRRTGVRWTYLAAIHLVETRMGRIRGTSTAGAVGPMQFLPSTWELYGAGGDIRDPRDAILAAARLLKANGAPGDMAEALWHYNPSDSYVRAVTEYARTMERLPTAYRGYWHWRVLYRHARGTYLLPVGYPEEPPVRVSRN
ncbi:MAG TPA: lytic transglycosylase domain-containing protein [Nocardioidaceae bacterium]|nr:lytic transglycosylase domain-containing protein [Nocardioidaceae bacterium]